MSTYHNNPALKEEAIKAAVWHRQQDMLVRGTYWDETEQRGCAIGCHAHHINPATAYIGSNQHQIVSDGYGLPLWLCHLEDWFFEHLPTQRAQQWPEQFLRAIPVGADLAPVRHQFLVYILDTVRPYANTDTRPIIDRVKALHQQALDGTPPAAETWAAAEAAARAGKTRAWAAAARAAAEWAAAEWAAARAWAAAAARAWAAAEAAAEWAAAEEAAAAAAARATQEAVVLEATQPEETTAAHIADELLQLLAEARP